jgi:hypothetical protein
MFGYLMEPRSGDYYDESDGDAVGTPWQWSELLWFPVILFIMFFVVPLIPLAYLVWCVLRKPYSSMKARLQNAKRSHLVLALAGIMVVEVLVCVFLSLQIGCILVGRCGVCSHILRGGATCIHNLSLRSLRLW